MNEQSNESLRQGYAGDAERWARISVTTREMAAAIHLPPEPDAWLCKANPSLAQLMFDRRRHAEMKRARLERSADYAEREAVKCEAIGGAA